MRTYARTEDEISKDLYPGVSPRGVHWMYVFVLSNVLIKLKLLVYKTGKGSCVEVVFLP